ncbi:MAG: hypothetical protein IPH13_21280, partial [Planctomycetes bacterium]|nr:hypothetical protein [Planctomycetota bacterium]
MNTGPTRNALRLVIMALLFVAVSAHALAQVDYSADGRPWSQRADGGPDAEVDGWYYNLGITGLRVRLIEESPTHLVVGHVFERSPAARLVRVGDHVVGAGGQRFATPHRNGYGMSVFGAHGPIADFATALELAQTKQRGGKLALTLLRAKKTIDVVLDVGTEYGAFSPTYPSDCPKSERIRKELLAYLVEQQQDDGSWGSPPYDVFAALALLGSGDAKYAAAVEKNARFHARTTSAKDDSDLINWRYMAAAIV